MSKIAIPVEYVWLDGTTPEPNLRSKTKVVYIKPDSTIKNVSEVPVEILPVWSFDGSSTGQADTGNSDCLLVPVYKIINPFRQGSLIVLCDVADSKGNPHPSSYRSKIQSGSDLWFGFEQEYVIMEDVTPNSSGNILGWPKHTNTREQGEYYCGIGARNVVGRQFAEEHLQMCLIAGLVVEGINAEVMLGQWEYQIFGTDPHTAADCLWLSRYILIRLAERYGYHIDFHPKPVKDFNGSGMHTNFSNKHMREVGGKEYFDAICEAMGENHEQTMKEYGSSNEMRLTGEYETASIGEFSYGVSDRGASIRIPIGVTSKDYKGYLEDRRPASNADPYRVVNEIIRCLAQVEIPEKAEILLTDGNK